MGSMTVLIPHPSPNFGPRPQRDGGARIDMLVLHYTGMEDGAGALARLCDADAQVSSHYLVEEDGRIFALVDEKDRAWHAGLSHWRGEGDCNSRSIGIEIVNGGHDFGLPPYPSRQIEALIWLCQGILHRHPAIIAANVVGHSDISPSRKEDPGELFPWPLLAQHGIGLWPFDGQENSDLPDAMAWDLLRRYGYDLNDPHAALIAFQRRYRPSHLTGQWDAECKGRLLRLCP